MAGMGAIFGMTNEELVYKNRAAIILRKPLLCWANTDRRCKLASARLSTLNLTLSFLVGD